MFKRNGTVKSNWFGFAFVVVLLAFFYISSREIAWLVGIGVLAVLWLATYLFPKEE